MPPRKSAAVKNPLHGTKEAEPQEPQPAGKAAHGSGTQTKGNRKGLASIKGKEKAVEVEGDGDDDLGDGEEEEEEEEGDERVERQGGGGVSAEDEESQKSIISLNKLDFRRPPVELRFGRWNNRPVTEKHVKQLLASMRKQGVRAFNPANRIPLIAKRSDLVNGCITRDTHLGADVPMLELSAAGLGKGEIIAAGGQHRWAAWKMAYEQGKKNIDKYEAQLTALRSKEPKGEKAKRTRETNISKITEEIKTERNFLDAISIWGVVIYDEGEYALQSEALTLNTNEL